jgi:hypothetical protein
MSQIRYITELSGGWFFLPSWRCRPASIGIPGGYSNEDCRNRGALPVTRFVAVLMSAALAFPLPAVSAEIGPLSPGGAAGVRQAQAESDSTTIILLGAGAAAGLALLLGMNNSGNAVAAMTITPASPTPPGGNSSGGSNQADQGQGEGPRGGGESGSVFNSVLADVGLGIVFDTTTTTTTTTTTLRHHAGIIAAIERRNRPEAAGTIRFAHLRPQRIAPRAIACEKFRRGIPGEEVVRVLVAQRYAGGNQKKNWKQASHWFSTGVPVV